MNQPDEAIPEVVEAPEQEPFTGLIGTDSIA